MEDVSYVLGPVSSLIAWRAAMGGILNEPAPSPRQVDFTRARARVRELQSLPAVQLLGDAPLDALVGRASQTHSCAGLDSIVLKQLLPPGSLYLIDKQTYICGPELCFLLLARGGADIHLAEIGCELCGTYHLAPDQSGTFSNGPALTSTEKLCSYLSQMSHRHGVKAAREILELVADGSDSPRETSLYLMLCAPDQWGGYGIRKPQLNARLDIGEAAQLQLGKGYLVVDELWRDEQGNPQAVTEYDSNQHHLHVFRGSGEKALAVEKLIADDKRREVIRETGVDVVTVRTEDTRSFDGFDAKALRIAKMVGDEPAPSEDDLRNQRISLFIELFHTNRWAKEHQLLRKMAGYERGIRKRHGK